MKGVRADFLRQIGLVDPACIGVNAAVQLLEAGAQAGDMRRLRGELQLAGAAEVAGDVLFGNDILDHVDRPVIGLVDPARAFGPEVRFGFAKPMSHAIVQVAPVAPRSASADVIGLEQGNTDTFTGQFARGIQSRKAAADHGHIDVAIDRAALRIAKGRCAVVPV